MARRPGRRGFAGAGRVRKLLNAMPDEARQEILALYRREGPIMEALMKSRVPVKTGAGRAAISHKIFEKSLVLRAGVIGTALNGLGKRLGGKRTRSVFYLRILERGRGGARRLTRVIRRRTPSGGFSRPFTARISPISRNRYDFIEGSVSRVLRARVRGQLKTIWAGALRRAARITGD